jgi:ribosomal-protein-alanine acetyltransferase
MSRSASIRALSFAAVEIALMREDDIDRVVDIERCCNPHPWTHNHFVEALKHGYLCLVARERESIVGFAVGHVLVDDAELLLIAVQPDHQRSGCATVLLNALVERLQSINRTPLHLEVRAGNHAAIAFYEARGFVRSGLRKNYYPNGVLGNQREDALLMQKAL